MIYSSGFALTAAHVLNGACNMLGPFPDENNKWLAHPRLGVERHPTEDAAVIRLPGDAWGSIFDLHISRPMTRGALARLVYVPIPDAATDPGPGCLPPCLWLVRAAMVPARDRRVARRYQLNQRTRED